ncbi:hypothetical protein MTO96_050144, partial [Rhipicephalus appendiculatus]
MPSPEPPLSYPQLHKLRIDYRKKLTECKEVESKLKD